jgi:hypothetical protein
MSGNDQEIWLSVIARSLALIALHKQELGNAGVGEKAAFLESLGLPRAQVAIMLDTSADSVAVMVGRIKRKGGKGRGKSTKTK